MNRALADHEALAEMAKLLEPVNAHAGEPISRLWTAKMANM